MRTRHIWLTLASLVVGAWATAASGQSTVHLYIYDTHTGAVTQATGPMERDPYNASFSNSGKMLVHDLTDTVTGAAQLLGVTNLATGTTTSLGVTGDNAVWSPNGKYIAYYDYQDWVDSGYDPNVPVQLRIIPAAGGTPIAVLDWATDPSWSNNSRRLAFWGWDGEIGTVGLDGTVTRFDFAALGSYEGYGCNPAYSPDGKLIVYQRYECFWNAPAPLMAIPVNEQGQPLGAPYPITTGAYYAEHPSFSNDGKSIVFVGNASDPGNFEWGIYTVSVYGGDPVLVFDRPGKGEWDAACSKNGRYIVFSGPE